MRLLGLVVGVALLKMSFSKQPMLFTLMFAELLVGLLFISSFSIKPVPLGITGAIVFLAIMVIEGVRGLILVVGLNWNGLFRSNWSVWRRRKSQ